MLASVLAGLYLSVYALRHRQVPGVNNFILLTIAIVILSLGKLIELLGTELSTKISGVYVLLIGITFSSLAWFMLGLQQIYRYRRTLKIVWISALTLICLDLIMIWTNGFHKLFWQETFIKEVGAFHVLGTVRGPLYLLHIALTYFLSISGSALLLARSFSKAKLYERQRVALILTVSIPLAANISFMLNIGGNTLDYTPIGYATACILLTYGYFRLHMVEAIPMAMDYVLEHLPDPVLIVDPQNRIQMINRAARVLLGDRKNRFSGENMADVMPHDSPYLLLNQLEPDSTLLIHDKERTYEARSRPVPARKGHAFGLLFILQDITQRLNAEEALQETLRYNRQFAEALPISFYALDETGNIVFANREMRNLFGYTTSELRKQNIDNLFKDTKIIEADQNEYSDNPAVKLEELTALSKEGKEFSVINMIANITDNKFLADRRGVIIDITERKQMEQATRLNLIAAEQASQVKSQFLANMSHEIRTPMNGVIGFAQLLTSTKLDKDQKRFVDLIVKSGKGLLQVINDILDISRIEAGKLDLEIAPFDPAKCISDVASIFEQSAKTKNIGFSCTVPKDLPSTTLGDPSRIAQILNNVVGNAVKFTQEGSVSVTVSYSLESDEATRMTDKITLVVEVTDTGIGIEKDRIEHLFDPFSQLDGSITRRFGGTGLGLAITQDLAKLMDASINVDSQPGKGSTFTIIIPLTIDTPVANNRQVSASESRADNNEQNFSHRKILLVEDNVVNQEVALGFLEKMGCKADIAVNGSDAVELAQCKAYDLILMDVHMPEMDGLEATSLIRAEGFSINTPIVGVTADVMVGQKEKCLSAGMNDHLPKPIVFQTLRDAVEKYLALSRE